jgi:predicted nucleic acid-binding protein
MKLEELLKDILGKGYLIFHDLPKNLTSANGEVEAVNLANELKAEIIVMDDIESIKKLENKTDIPILFSSFIIYSLFEHKIISRKEGLSAIRSMKTKRQWKENLIIEYANFLFEKEEK